MFDKEIEGVYFWERIRFSVYQQILESLNLCRQANAEIKKTILNKIFFTLRSLKSLFLINSLFTKPTKIVFFGHPRRKFLEDGKWWDIYCDPIIEKLKKKDYVYLEYPYLFGHFRPAKTENLRYLDFINLQSAIIRKFGLIKIRVNKQEKSFIEKIQEKIEKEFNINIDLVSIIVNDLLVRKSRISIYRKLLKQLSPEIVILVVSYGQETVIEICKELGIPTIELQHGVISKYDVGYSFHGERRRKRMFPDYLFTFSDYWKNSVDFPIKKDHIFSIGYPYLEKENNKYSNTIKKNQILFISQRTIGKELSKFAVEVSGHKEISYNVIYKLHPREHNHWKKEYPWLAKANNEGRIKVNENETRSLYELMAESKIQVGVYSTAIYEGLNFGLKTYLLNVFGIEYMDFLLLSGAAEKVSTSNEFVEKIKKDKINREVEKEYFFRKGSIENFFTVLKSILLSIGKRQKLV